MEQLTGENDPAGLGNNPDGGYPMEVPGDMADSKASVRKSSRPRKQSKRALESEHSLGEEYPDVLAKKKQRKEFNKKFVHKKDILPNGRPFKCSMCESTYINTSPAKARLKKEVQPIVKEKFGQILQLCVKCASVVNQIEHKGPSPEQRAQFEEEGKKFAQHLIQCLNDNSAARLFCSFYQTSKCGCIQAYIRGTPSSSRRRKSSLSGSEATLAPDMTDIKKEDLTSLDGQQRERAMLLLGLLKESISKKQAPSSKKSQEKQNWEAATTDLMKESERFILDNRKKLKELGICERGCQKVLCYSNNFLHKKPVGHQPRLMRTKGQAALGKLCTIEELPTKQCCDKHCVKQAEKSQSKLVQWRERAQMGQKEMWKVLEEMLTPPSSETGRTNCFKFISMVTGCCMTTVQKVYAGVLLRKGEPGCAREREHGMRFHWRRQKELSSSKNDPAASNPPPQQLPATRTPTSNPPPQLLPGTRTPTTNPPPQQLPETRTLTTIPPPQLLPGTRTPTTSCCEDSDSVTVSGLTQPPEPGLMSAGILTVGSKLLPVTSSGSCTTWLQDLMSVCCCEQNCVKLAETEGTRLITWRQRSELGGHTQLEQVLGEMLALPGGPVCTKFVSLVTHLAEPEVSKMYSGLVLEGGLVTGSEVATGHAATAGRLSHVQADHSGSCSTPGPAHSTTTPAAQHNQLASQPVLARTVILSRPNLPENKQMIIRTVSTTGSDLTKESQVTGPASTRQNVSENSQIPIRTVSFTRPDLPENSQTIMRTITSSEKELSENSQMHARTEIAVTADLSEKSPKASKKEDIKHQFLQLVDKIRDPQEMASVQLMLAALKKELKLNEATEKGQKELNLKQETDKSQPHLTDTSLLQLDKMLPHPLLPQLTCAMSQSSSALSQPAVLLSEGLLPMQPFKLSLPHNFLFSPGQFSTNEISSTPVAASAQGFTAEKSSPCADKDPQRVLRVSQTQQNPLHASRQGLDTVKCTDTSLQQVNEEMSLVSNELYISRLPLLGSITSSETVAGSSCSNPYLAPMSVSNRDTASQLDDTCHVSIQASRLTSAHQQLTSDEPEVKATSVYELLLPDQLGAKFQSCCASNHLNHLHLPSPKVAPPLDLAESSNLPAASQMQDTSKFSLAHLNTPAVQDTCKPSFAHLNAPVVQVTSMQTPMKSVADNSASLPQEINYTMAAVNSSESSVHVKSVIISALPSSSPQVSINPSSPLIAEIQPAPTRYVSAACSSNLAADQQPVVRSAIISDSIPESTQPNISHQETPAKHLSSSIINFFPALKTEQDSHMHQVNNFCQLLPSSSSGAVNPFIFMDPSAVSSAGPSSCSSTSFVFDALADSPIKEPNLLLSSSKTSPPAMQPVPVTSSLLSQMLLCSIAPMHSAALASQTAEKVLSTVSVAGSIGKTCPIPSISQTAFLQESHYVTSSLSLISSLQTSPPSAYSQSLKFNTNTTPSSSSKQLVVNAGTFEQTNLSVIVPGDHSTSGSAQKSLGRLSRPRDPPQVGIVQPYVSGIKVSPIVTAVSSSFPVSSGSLTSSLPSSSVPSLSSVLAQDDHHQVQISTSLLEPMASLPVQQQQQQQHVFLPLLLNSPAAPHPLVNQSIINMLQAGQLNLSAILGNQGTLTNHLSTASSSELNHLMASGSQNQLVSGSFTATALSLAAPTSSAAQGLQAPAMTSNQAISYDTQNMQLPMGTQNLFQNVVCPDTGNIKLMPMILSNTDVNLGLVTPGGQLLLNMAPGLAQVFTPSSHSSDVEGSLLISASSAGQGSSSQHLLNINDYQVIFPVPSSSNSVHSDSDHNTLAGDRPNSEQFGDRPQIRQHRNRPQRGQTVDRLKLEQYENRFQGEQIEDRIKVEHHGERLQREKTEERLKLEQCRDKFQEEQTENGNIVLQNFNQVKTTNHETSSHTLLANFSGQQDFPQKCLNTVLTSRHPLQPVSGSDLLPPSSVTESGASCFQSFLLSAPDGRLLVGDSPNVGSQTTSSSDVRSPAAGSQVVKLEPRDNFKANSQSSDFPMTRSYPDHSSVQLSELQSGQTFIKMSTAKQFFLSTQPIVGDLNQDSAKPVKDHRGEQPAKLANMRMPAHVQANMTIPATSLPKTPGTNFSTAAAQDQLSQSQVVHESSAPVHSSPATQSSSVGGSHTSTTKHRPIRPKTTVAPTAALTQQSAIFLVPDQPGLPSYQLTQNDQLILPCQQTAERHDGTAPLLQAQLEPLSFNNMSSSETVSELLQKLILVPGSSPHFQSASMHSQNIIIMGSPAEANKNTEVLENLPQSLLQKTCLPTDTSQIQSSFRSSTLPTQGTPVSHQKNLPAQIMPLPQTPQLSVGQPLESLLLEPLPALGQLGDSSSFQMLVIGDKQYQVINQSGGLSSSISSLSPGVSLACGSVPTPAPDLSSNTTFTFELEGHNVQLNDLSNAPMLIQSLPPEFLAVTSTPSYTFSNISFSSPNIVTTGTASVALTGNAALQTILQLLPSPSSKTQQAAVIQPVVESEIQKSNPLVASQLRSRQLHMSKQPNLVSSSTAEQQDHPVHTSENSQGFQSVAADLQQTLNQSHGLQSVRPDIKQSQFVVLKNQTTNLDAPVRNSNVNPSAQTQLQLGAKEVLVQFGLQSLNTNSVGLSENQDRGTVQPTVDLLNPAEHPLKRQTSKTVSRSYKMRIKETENKEVNDQKNEVQTINNFKEIVYLKTKDPEILIASAQKEENSVSSVKDQISLSSRGTPNLQSILAFPDMKSKNVLVGHNLMEGQTPKQWVNLKLGSGTQTKSTREMDGHDIDLKPPREVSVNGSMHESNILRFQDVPEEFQKKVKASQSPEKAQNQDTYVQKESCDTTCSEWTAVRCLTTTESPKHVKSERGRNSENTYMIKSDSDLAPQVPLHLKTSPSFDVTSQAPLHLKASSSLAVNSGGSLSMSGQPLVGGSGNTQQVTSSAMTVLHTDASMFGPPNITLITPEQVGSSQFLKMFQDSGGIAARLPVSAAPHTSVSNKIDYASQQWSGSTGGSGNESINLAPLQKVENLKPHVFMARSNQNQNLWSRSLFSENSLQRNLPMERSPSELSALNLSARPRDVQTKLSEAVTPSKTKARKRPSTIMDLIRNKEKQQAEAAAAQHQMSPASHIPEGITLMLTAPDGTANFLMLDPAMSQLLNKASSGITVDKNTLLPRLTMTKDVPEECGPASLLSAPVTLFSSTALSTPSFTMAGSFQTSASPVTKFPVKDSSVVSSSGQQVSLVIQASTEGQASFPGGLNQSPACSGTSPATLQGPVPKAAVFSMSETRLASSGITMTTSASNITQHPGTKDSIIPTVLRQNSKLESQATCLSEKTQSSISNIRQGCASNTDQPQKINIGQSKTSSGSDQSQVLTGIGQLSAVNGPLTLKLHSEHTKDPNLSRISSKEFFSGDKLKFVSLYKQNSDDRDQDVCSQNKLVSDSISKNNPSSAKLKLIGTASPDKMYPASAVASVSSPHNAGVCNQFAPDHQEKLPQRSSQILHLMKAKHTMSQAAVEQSLEHKLGQSSKFESTHHLRLPSSGRVVAREGLGAPLKASFVPLLNPHLAKNNLSDRDQELTFKSSMSVSGLYPKDDSLMLKDSQGGNSALGATSISLGNALQSQNPLLSNILFKPTNGDTPASLSLPIAAGEPPLHAVNHSASPEHSASSQMHAASLLDYSPSSRHPQARWQEADRPSLGHTVNTTSDCGTFITKPPPAYSQPHHFETATTRVNKVINDIYKFPEEEEESPLPSESENPKLQSFTLKSTTYEQNIPRRIQDTTCSIGKRSSYSAQEDIFLGSLANHDVHLAYSPLTSSPPGDRMLQRDSPSWNSPKRWKCKQDRSGCKKVQFSDVVTSQSSESCQPAQPSSETNLLQRTGNISVVIGQQVGWRSQSVSENSDYPHVGQLYDQGKQQTLLKEEMESPASSSTHSTEIFTEDKREFKPHRSRVETLLVGTASDAAYMKEKLSNTFNLVEPKQGLLYRNIDPKERREVHNTYSSRGNSTSSFCTVPEGKVRKTRESQQYQSSQIMNSSTAYEDRHFETASYNTDLPETPLTGAYLVGAPAGQVSQGETSHKGSHEHKHQSHCGRNLSDNQTGLSQRRGQPTAHLEMQDANSRGPPFDGQSSFDILSRQGYSKLSKQRLNEMSILLEQPLHVKCYENRTSETDDNFDSGTDLLGSTRPGSILTTTSYGGMERPALESPVVRHEILETNFELARHMKKEHCNISRDSKYENHDGKTADYKMMYSDRRPERMNYSMSSKLEEFPSSKVTDLNLKYYSEKVASTVYLDAMQTRSSTFPVGVKMSRVEKDMKAVQGKNQFLRLEVAKAGDNRTEEQRPKYMLSSDKLQSLTLEPGKLSPFPSGSQFSIITDDSGTVSMKKSVPSSTVIGILNTSPSFESYRPEDSFLSKVYHSSLASSGGQAVQEPELTFQVLHSKTPINLEDYPSLETFSREGKDLVVTSSIGCNKYSNQRDPMAGQQESTRHRYPSSEIKSLTRVLMESDDFIPISEQKRQRNLSSSLALQSVTEVDSSPTDLAQRHRNLSSSSLKHGGLEMDFPPFDPGTRNRNPSSSSWVMKHWEISDLSLFRNRNPSGSSNRRSRPGSSSSDRDHPSIMDELSYFPDIIHTRSRNSSGESLEPTVDFHLDPQQMLQYTYPVEPHLKRPKH